MARGVEVPMARGEGSGDFRDDSRPFRPERTVCPNPAAAARGWFLGLDEVHRRDRNRQRREMLDQQN